MKKIVTLFVLLIQLTAYGQKPIPELWGLHVHDEAHILSQQTVDHLENQLNVYGDSTSNQLAILIVPSLEGEILEAYALKVAEKWNLGQKDKDNGALLFIAVDDHKMRIETGLGLEGVLTDAVCNQIIRNEIAPNFRKSDYDAGVRAGVDAMIGAIGGEYTADDSTNGQTAELGLTERIFIGLFIFGILGVFAVIGLFAPGGAGWFVYLFLIPFYATFPLVVLGVTAGLSGLGIYVILFPIIKIVLSKSSLGKRISKKFAGGNGKGRTGRWSSGGGWSGSSGSSWSSGGGSSSGSSFSGGGGSFGGGGSSGSW
jgi:uncharacterized protein